MGSDFMAQFQAGWQMGQGRNENARRNADLQMEQERQRFIRQQQMEELKLKKQEIDLQSKRLKQEDTLREFDLAEKARMTQAAAPPPTAAMAGIPQQSPEMAGPPPEQIQIPQPMQQVESVTGGPALQLPKLFGGQIAAMQAAAESKKRREAEDAIRFKAKTEADYRESPSLQHVETANGIQTFNPKTGQLGPVLAPGKKPSGSAITAEEYSPDDVRAFPVSWRDTNEGTRVQESYTTRNNNRASAMNAALQAGAVLPSKKGLEEAMTAQQLVAAAERIKALLEAPVDPNKPDGLKAKDYFGPAESRMAALRQAGYGSAIPQPVIAAREAIGRFAAKDRHEIYGAAVTPLESKFAASFIADLNAPGKTLSGQLDAYIANLTHGMDSTWGQGTKKKPAGAPAAPTGSKYKIVEVR